MSIKSVADKYESIITKQAQDALSWAKLVGNYDTSAVMLDDLVEGMKLSAKNFWEESDKDELSVKILAILEKQVEIFAKLRPELEATDLLFNEF